MSATTRILQLRRRRKARRLAGRRRWRPGPGALLPVALLLLLPVALFVGGAWWMVRDAQVALAPLPAPGQAAVAGSPTRFHDRSGEVLLLATQEVRDDAPAWRRLAELPALLVAATLLAEDPDFLTRPAPSPVSLALRLWQNRLGGTAAQDGSLTARLARRLYAPAAAGALQREREIVLVAELERRHSRETLLEWHLNSSDYGQDARGIEAAARLYLGKAATALTLDEIALLAAIPAEPGLNPWQQEAAARRRQAELLREMRRAGLISAGEAAAARARVTPVQAHSQPVAERAADFSAYAQRQARAILDAQGLDGERLLARGGLRIVTTLDLALQERAECLLEMHLGRLGAAPAIALPCPDAALLAPAEAMPAPPQEGALALLDVRSGELLALQGAADARRHPPGPLLQPFVYFEGFRRGRTAADMLLDIPLELPAAIEGLIYTPANADGRYHGPLSLREAMSAGRLPPAVQLASELRLDKVLAGAQSLGLGGLDVNASPGLSLLEYGGGISLLDAAGAYSLFATQGEQRGPLAVLRIEDRQGALLWQAPRSAAAECSAAAGCTPVFAAELGYLVNDVLADQGARARVLGEEGAQGLDVGRPAAVVSGMTGQRRAAWTLGYTPRYLAAVQLGRSDGSAMSAAEDVNGPAAALWRALMLALHEGRPVETWARPATIVEAEVCERSGLLPNGICPLRRERFIAGVLPQQVDEHWQLFAINAGNGRLATVDTPAALLSQRIHFVPPAEAMDWWRESGRPLPPDTLDEPGQVAVSLTQPAPFARVGGRVEIRGTLAAELDYYLLEQGAGLRPLQWQPVDAGREAADAGLLGTWDTAGLAGLHSLRLTVVRRDGSRETALRQVTVDNEAPSLRLEPGDTELLWPAQRELQLNAAAVDNLAVARVDFYRNGHLLGSDRARPWGLAWRIEGPGTEVFRAVAHDEVGNQASDEMTLRVAGSRSRN